MAMNYADTAMMGGGFGGGFGGGWGGGLSPFGLFGALPLGGGYGSGGCGCPTPVYDICGKDKCHDHCHNGHNGNGRHSEEVILEDAHHNSIISGLAGLKDCCCKTDYDVADNAHKITKNVDDRYAMLDKDVLINRYELGKQIDKCCCETNHNVDKSTMFTNSNIDKGFCSLSKQISDCCCEIEKQASRNTQTLLNELKENEVQALRDRLCKCEKDNDFFRFNGIVGSTVANAVSSFRQQAATAGSNFVGPGSTVSSNTSNNSGQING